jgi:deoxyribose-phosphate aldolase
MDTARREGEPVNDDIDRLVAVIAERVKARLADARPASPDSLAPAGGELRDAPCLNSPTHEDCGGCGMCAARRPWSVRAIRSEGACRVGAGVDIGKVDVELAGMIDHTLLKAEATAEEVKKLCDEARKYCFASVCVNSTNVARARSFLEGAGVMVCAVVGFPLGAMTPTAKAFEAREAVRAGADEIDMVINLGALKSRDYALVEDDIRKVVQAARPAKVKVILETGALSAEEKVIAITLSKIGGAAFVKTSTGFGPGGATVEDVALMRRLVGDQMGVKASGGVRTHEDAEKMRLAGADRIGASASVAIVSGEHAATSAKQAKGY